MKNTRNNILLILIAAMIMTVVLTSCTKDSDEDTIDEQSLEDVADKLCSGIDVPPNETVMLDETNFEFFAFIPYDDSLSAAAADALVNITPHSLVVIHADNGNGAELAKKVAENADPNKWLCVRAEALRVAYTDHYIVLVMSYKDIADGVIENFKEIAKDLDGMDMSLQTSVDFSYE